MSRFDADAVWKILHKARKSMSTTADKKRFCSTSAGVFELYKAPTDTGCNVVFTPSEVHVFDRSCGTPWILGSEHIKLFDAVVLWFTQPQEAELMLQGIAKRLQGV